MSCDCPKGFECMCPTRHRDVDMDWREEEQWRLSEDMGRPDFDSPWRDER